MPEGHVFSGLQNRIGPLSIAPAGTKDYSVCSVRAIISSWVSGDRAVKNAEYPATRTTKIAVLVRMFLGFQQRVARHDVVLDMPAFVHLEESAQQHHQLLLIGLVLQR